MNALILHTNKLLAASSISVTSEAAGFEKEKAYDYRTTSFWKAAAAGTVYYTVDMGVAVNVNAWSCFAQTLPDNSGTIKLQYSSDNFAADINDFSVLVTPADNTPIMKYAAVINARYWRWAVSSTGAASSIGVLWLGEYLEFDTGVETGFQPLALAQQYIPIDSETIDGGFNGRTIKKVPVRGLLRFSKANGDAWMRANWPTLLRAIEAHPFFVMPLPDAAPTEVYYCWMPSKIKTPATTGSMHLSAEIPILAYVS